MVIFPQKNILVTNGKMILIDYDGMYVPELAGEKSTEGGNPNFQHLRRNESHFGPDLDRFSEIVIYLSLRALSLAPELHDRYGLGIEGLLFTQSDFRNPYSSKLLVDLERISELSKYIQKFKTLCQSPLSTVPALNAFLNEDEIRIPQDKVKYESIPLSLSEKNWPIFAGKTKTLLKMENESVTVIGKIDAYREGVSIRRQPYLLLNVGVWPNHKFTVVMWSEVLEMLTASHKKASDYKDQWISVSGVISVYNRKT
jgi:hypothetical protein